MKILVEHPIFCPYQEKITGGTELFVHRVKEALSLLGHEVDVFGTADSTLPCIQSSAYSTQWMQTQNAGNTKSKDWYDDLTEASKDFDKVILNTSLSSTHLLNSVYAPLLNKSIYFNHNASDWFVRGFAGRQMQSIVRYMRSLGGKSFYFAESNRAALEFAWNTPAEYQRATSGKVATGLRRLVDHSFLSLEMWDDQFNQAVCPHDAVEPRAPEGYLVFIGRNDPNKRLRLAQKKAKDLGRELRVLTDVPHEEAMHVLAGADCLLLSSKNETFCITAFEALCHGIPVSCLEAPPALDFYPELARGWGDVTPNTFEERQKISADLRSKYTLEAFGERLVNTFHIQGGQHGE